MASAIPRQLAVVLLLLVIAVASPAAMRAAATCASEKFPAGRVYKTCEDLPHLGAALHWTYNAATSELSLAFVAPPPAPSGWVAWGINPTGEGMVGAQALVALKGSSSSSSLAVKTYNISGYVPLGGASTSIAFPATDLAADEGSGGKIRLYGKLQLHGGMETVNQVWQVGSSVTGGAPDKHAFAAENLAAKGKLALAGGGAGAPSPAPAPLAGGPSGSGAETAATSSPSPSGGKSPSAASTVSGMPAPAAMLLALVGFLAMV